MGVRRAIEPKTEAFAACAFWPDQDLDPALSVPTRIIYRTTMANGLGDSTMFGPDASLTLDEQSLLQTALAYNSSNKSKLNGSFGAPKIARGSGAAAGTGSLSPAQPFMDPQNNPLYQSPIQDVSNIGVDSFGVDDSPFIDGHDFEDGNFDWDNSGDLLFGDLPERPDHEDGDIHDKRKNSHDDDDEDGQNKRREGNEKNNKKPGRKPLNNSEPTTVSLLQSQMPGPFTNAQEEA